MKQIEEKKCSICGENFTGRNNRQKRCSNCTKTYLLRCKECGAEYESHSPKSQICLGQTSTSCSECGKKYSYACGELKRNRTCGNTACILSLRAKTSNNISHKCPTCSEIVHGGKRGKSCGEEREGFCEYCGKIFLTPCKKEKKRFCRPQCAQSHRKQTLSFTRTCQICSRKFTTKNPGQKYCKLSHEIPCKFCFAPVTTKNQNITAKRKVFCQKYCRDLYKIEITSTPAEYIELLKEKEKGATIDSLREKFSKILFSKMLIEFLTQGTTPSLEDIVYEHCSSMIDSKYIERKARVIRGKKINSMLEIDVYIPSLKIGFEVQDFWTHSRTSNTEKFEYGLKRGPEYHELKRTLALEQLGVEIIDIWEDSIKSGAYRDQILQAILKATNGN